MTDQIPPLKEQAHKLRGKLREIGGPWNQVQVYWRPDPRGFWLRGAPAPYNDEGSPELHLGLTFLEAKRDVRRIRRVELAPRRRERFKRFMEKAKEAAKVAVPIIIDLISKRRR